MITNAVWLRTRGLATALAVALLITCTSTAVAQERGPQLERQMTRAHEILEGLEHGMVALEKLEAHEAHMMLERIADRVRERIHELEGRMEREGRAREREREHAEGEGANRERAMARRQIEALEMALLAFREAERMDAVELIEIAIKARVIGLEGVRGAEFQELRRRHPPREQLIEILTVAEGIYREFGMEERAAHLSRLTEELWPPRGDRGERGERARGAERDRDREREADRARRTDRARETDRLPMTDRSRERLVHEIEVMRMAYAALMEAERPDTAERLGLAIRVREMALEGMRGEEARAMRERAPDRAAEIEILGHAAELWQKFGHERKAAAVGELHRRMLEEWQQARAERERGQAAGRERGERERGEREHAERGERGEREHGERERALMEADERAARLERHLAELERAIAELRRELRELRDGGR